MTVFGVGLDTLAAFALTSALIELTPGPNMTYLAIVAATEGRRTGYAAVGGVALGLLLVGLAASLGLATLIGEIPALYETLRWAGILYLLWLAWEAWSDGDGPEGLAEPGASSARFFARGFVTNLLNPKAGVFYVAVLPTFIAPSSPPLSQTVTLTVLYVAIATLIHAGIVTLAGAARRFLAAPRRAQILRRVLALALVAVAAWLGWSTRRA